MAGMPVVSTGWAPASSSCPSCLSTTRVMRLTGKSRQPKGKTERMHAHESSSAAVRFSIVFFLVFPLSDLDADPPSEWPSMPSCVICTPSYTRGRRVDWPINRVRQDIDRERKDRRLYHSVSLRRRLRSFIQMQTHWHCLANKSPLCACLLIKRVKPNAKASGIIYIES